MTTLSTDGIQPSPEVREANAARYDGRRHVEPCRFCEKGLTRPPVWLVEITYRGRLVHDDERFARPDSQGAFAIGPECARKVPPGFKLKASSLAGVG